MRDPVNLVLLPGLDGTDAFLKPLLAHLPGWVRPVVVTYPARGGQGYGDLLPRVREAVSSLPACHVLGWSFAGPLALMLAAAEREKVRSVILAASFVRAPQPLLGRFGFALNTPAVWAWRLARRIPVWMLRPREDLFRIAKTRTWRTVPAATIAARLHAIRTVDAREILRECAQPLLCLAARDDGTVPRRNTEEIARLRPDATIVTMEGSHFAMFTHPRVAAEAIARFVVAGR